MREISLNSAKHSVAAQLVNAWLDHIDLEAAGPLTDRIATDGDSLGGPIRRHRLKRPSVVDDGAALHDDTRAGTRAHGERPVQVQGSQHDVAV